MTRAEIESEIALMRAEHRLPSQALLEEAIRRGWLSVFLQNVVVNNGPGELMRHRESRCLRQIVEQLEGGLDRDF